MIPRSSPGSRVDHRRPDDVSQADGAAPVRLGAGGPAEGENRRWQAFALLVVAYFMTIVDLTIVNVALPTIGVKLHFPESDLQWVVTAYGLTFGGFLLLGGRAADLLGRRRLLMAGMAIFTVASLACGLATSDTLLVVMRGVQGFGAAVVLPAALSIVMNMFPEGAERNKALGIWGAVGAMGATVGLVAGGLLTRYIGWQYIFFFNVPVGVTALVLAPHVVPESRLRSDRRRYDPFGAVTITAGLVTLVYAVSQAPQIGWAAAQTVAMLLAAAALLVGFLIVETRVEAPLLPLRLFRLSTVAGSNAVGFLLTASFYTFIFVGTLYMQQVLGYSALKTGVAWLVASLTSVACAGMSQMLVTKTSAKLVMAFGMALIGGGILWATQISTDGNFWRDLAGPFFVAGMGTAFAFIPVSIGALAGVVEGDAGVASGLLNTAQQLGGAIGVAVASSIAASHFDTLIHHGYGTAAALTGGFQRALWVCGLTGLLAIPVVFILIRRAEGDADRRPPQTVDHAAAASRGDSTMIPWEDEERRLDALALAAGDPTGWFEELYAAGAAGRVSMPWSRTEPHELLAEWTRPHQPDGVGRRAIVVGCGLGADAEHVASLGFDTVAFDVSPTAVAIARERHPDSPVRYVTADLLAPPPEWQRAFDLVVEVVTVQALPDPPRRQAIVNVGRLVASGGTLLAIAERHTADAKTGPGLPWPLRREEIEAFATDGLTVHRIEQLTVAGELDEARWRAEMRRPPSPGKALRNRRIPQLTLLSRSEQNGAAAAGLAPRTTIDLGHSHEG